MYRERPAIAAARHRRCTNRDCEARDAARRPRLGSGFPGARPLSPALRVLISGLSFVAGIGIQNVWDAAGDDVVRQPAGRWFDGRVGTADFSRWTKGCFHRPRRRSESGGADGRGIGNLGCSDEASGVRSPHPRGLGSRWIQGLFHARFTLGVNVYSIPSVGGEERLVLDNAYFPEPLPDGSLLITRSNAAAQPQLHRFWPEDNRIEPLPVYLTGRCSRSSGSGSRVCRWERGGVLWQNDDCIGLDLRPAFTSLICRRSKTRPIACKLRRQRDTCGRFP